EVVEVVRSVSGVDFPAIMAECRAGDPATLVAAADRILVELGWTPKFGDLETIVRHALSWEAQLARRNA
ncbi:UDP-glucose 4-epimerase GalE, partial [Xanthobacter flavus]